MSRIQQKLDLLEEAVDLLSEEDPLRVELEDTQLLMYPQAFSATEANLLMLYCMNNIPWRQDCLTIAGKQIPLPRLQCWYGTAGANYRYSGLSLDPLPWTDTLLKMRQRVEAITGNRFNAVLANYYRNGTDSVSWHSDDESELGNQPVIASVSLGATRVFQIKHKTEKKRRVLNIPLTHGSILLMGKNTQNFWQHQLPKDCRVTDPRINLTLRKVVSSKARS